MEMFFFVEIVLEVFCFLMGCENWVYIFICFVDGCFVECDLNVNGVSDEVWINCFGIVELMV